MNILDDCADAGDLANKVAELTRQRNDLIALNQTLRNELAELNWYLDNTPDMVCVISQSRGIIARVNPAFCRRLSAHSWLA